MVRSKSSSLSRPKVSLSCMRLAFISGMENQSSREVSETGSEVKHREGLFSANKLIIFLILMQERHARMTHTRCITSSPLFSRGHASMTICTQYFALFYFSKNDFPPFRFAFSPSNIEMFIVFR